MLGLGGMLQRLKEEKEQQGQEQSTAPQELMPKPLPEVVAPPADMMGSVPQGQNTMESSLMKRFPGLFGGAKKKRAGSIWDSIRERTAKGKSYGDQ